MNVIGNMSPGRAERSVQWVVDNYDTPDRCRRIRHTLDSITNTCDIGYRLTVDKVATNLPVSKFNIECFPGLHIKLETGAVVIFSSGKINILGRKNQMRSNK